MAVIHSPSKDRIIGRDGDNAISVFDHMLHVTHFSSLGTENHFPIKIAVGWGSKGDGRDGDNCERRNRFWRSLEVSATKQDHNQARDRRCQSQLSRDRLRAEVVHQNESDHEAAQS